MGLDVASASRTLLLVVRTVHCIAETPQTSSSMVREKTARVASNRPRPRLIARLMVRSFIPGWFRLDNPARAVVFCFVS